MTPQVYDLGPDGVREAFGELGDASRAGNTATLERGCERVQTLLAESRVGSVTSQMNVQVSRSRFIPARPTSLPEAGR